jgi:hypothetical protein
MRPLGSSLQSPSFGNGSDTAQPYELKFLIDAAAAAKIEEHARAFMTPDAHGDTAGVYSTTTLYLDTASLDVFHRSPSYRRRKFRIRRYGHSALVSLERKTRSGDRVRKRRSSIPDLELGTLAHDDSPPDWSGHWFHKRLRTRALLPSALVTYDRTALTGATPEGPVRLTIDRQIRGRVADVWQVATVDSGIPLLAGQPILELKFLDHMPQVFKALVAHFNLMPASVSKYRVCREAWAAATAPAPAATGTARA